MGFMSSVSNCIWKVMNLMKNVEDFMGVLLFLMKYQSSNGNCHWFNKNWQE